MVLVNNIPGRLFSTWQYQSLSLTAVRMDGSKQQDTFENSVTEALTLLYKLANEFLKAKAQMKVRILLLVYEHFLWKLEKLEIII